MRFNDAVFGIVLIVFAVAEIAYTTTFPRLHGQNYGPDLFPTIIGLGLMVCGILLVWKGFATRATQPMMAVGDWAQDRRNVLNLGLLIASIVFYILLSQWLGFLLTSLFILALLLHRLGTSWIHSLLLSAATTLIIHTLFAQVLLVPLPWGILLPIAW